jgi:hypothetical protein
MMRDCPPRAICAVQPGHGHANNALPTQKYCRHARHRRTNLAAARAKRPSSRSHVLAVLRAARRWKMPSRAARPKPSCRQSVPIPACRLRHPAVAWVSS